MAAILDLVRGLGGGQRGSLLSGSDHWRGANKSFRGRHNDMTRSVSSAQSTSTVRRRNCDMALQRGIQAVVVVVDEQRC